MRPGSRTRWRSSPPCSPTRSGCGCSPTWRTCRCGNRRYWRSRPPRSTCSAAAGSSSGSGPAGSGRHQRHGRPAAHGGRGAPGAGEAIEIIRAMWRPGETVRVAGEHYAVSGVHAGPAPAHPVGIWIGAVGPKALAFTGRVGDGWAAPIPHYLPYEKWRASQDVITRAAEDAGRDPSAVTRVAQLVGDITEAPGTVRLQGGADPHRRRGLGARARRPRQRDRVRLLRVLAGGQRGEPDPPVGAGGRSRGPSPSVSPGRTDRVAV